MDKWTIIKNYAQALFENAKDNNILDQVYEELESINQIIQNEQALSSIIISPIIKKTEKINLINIIEKHLNIEKIVKDFLFILIKNSRMDSLGGINNYYLKLLNESKNIKVVKVISSKKILIKEQSKLKKLLEERLKMKVKMELAIDDSIIGGIVFQYDSKILDFSILGVLKKIKKSSINALNSA